MRSEELFEIIDGIDDDIILDVPEADAQRPIEIVVESSSGRRTSFLKLALSAACLVCVLAVGTFAAVKLRDVLRTESGSSDPVISDDSSDSSSSSSSDPETSDPEQDDYILDENILNEMSLSKDELPKLELLGDTEGLEYTTLAAIRTPNGDPSVRGLCLTETGPAIWLSNYPNYHYFWIDNDGNELDHVGFNFYEQKDRIPNINYPGSDVFVLDGEVLYYSGGRLKKTVQLPQSHRASFSPDNLQYLYIDPERNKLELYFPETESFAVKGMSVKDLGYTEPESAVNELSVQDLGFSEPWVFDFVNVVTPKLATVTLLECDENMASEYQGNENFRTLLLELPTLNVIQQLPDGAELTALGDDVFLMTKQEGGVRRISGATLSHSGKLNEIDSDVFLNEKSPYYASSNIILSPNKLTALLIDDGDKSDLRFRAVSVENQLQVLWEAHISAETIGTPGYPYAAITDDAVMYIIGESWDSGEKYLYRIGAKK